MSEQDQLKVRKIGTSACTLFMICKLAGFISCSWLWIIVIILIFGLHVEISGFKIDIQ